MHALIREVILSDNNLVTTKEMSQKMCSKSHTNTQFRNVRINVHRLDEIMHALIKNMIQSDENLKTKIKKTEPKKVLNVRPKIWNSTCKQSRFV